MSLASDLLRGGKLPGPLRRLVREVQQVLRYDDLRPEWAAKAVASCNVLTGNCANASGVIWYVLGRVPGWKFRSLPARVWPEGGPHYFLIHEPTGLILDPTAGQYPKGMHIPYERAEGRAPATRGRDKRGRALPLSAARPIVQRLLATPGGRSAVRAALRWSRAHAA